MSPQRIQLSRARGWRLPEGVVSVARPTRWGNPWRIVQDWSERQGIKANTIVHRLRRGWDVDRALTTPGRALLELAIANGADQ